MGIENFGKLLERKIKLKELPFSININRFVAANLKIYEKRYPEQDFFYDRRKKKLAVINRL
jgi:hypothetical protein